MGGKYSREAAKQSIVKKINKIVLVVVGETGSGKSTLINCLIGKDEAPAGKDSKGITKEITSYYGKFLDSEVELIDTPGFGDLTVRAEERFKDWKKSMEGKKINAVLFLHKATEDRFTNYNAALSEVLKECFDPLEFDNRAIIIFSKWDLVRE